MPLTFVRDHLLAVPNLTKFALLLAVIVGAPALGRRVRLPAAVSLLFAGMIIGPHGLGLFGANHPVVAFLSELGKLLLMFMAGLEVNLERFNASRTRALVFGLLTTSFPQILGSGVALLFGYQLIPAIVIGSLLASHTLLGLPTIVRLGLSQKEPVTVVIGATVMSDTLSLIVFAICVSTFQTGFSALALGRLLLEISLFVPLILFGVSRVGARLLNKVKDQEDVYFVVMLAIIGIAGSLAESISLPPIVGAFLAGLAVNAAVPRNHPAHEKLGFFGASLFIPIFFIATGFLIDLRVFIGSVESHFALVLAVILALLVGKGIAAEIAGRAFEYARAARETMWSLTLPQVAATLAATLVGHETFNASGQRLLDTEMLNVVFVLILTTSILGPVLTERFAPGMQRPPQRLKTAS